MTKHTKHKVHQSDQRARTQAGRQVSGPLAQVQAEAPPAAVELVATVTGVVDGGAHLERLSPPQAGLWHPGVHAVRDVCKVAVVVVVVVVS